MPCCSGLLFLGPAMDGAVLLIADPVFRREDLPYLVVALLASAYLSLWLLFPLWRRNRAGRPAA